MDKINVIKTFLFKTIPDMASYDCNLDFIKFVFKKEDIAKLEEIVIFDEDYDKYVGLNTIKLLYDSNDNPDDNSIRINDYDEFFDTMKLIFDECEKRDTKGNSVIRGIWLRMGVEDLNHVEDFLKKELEFIKSDGLFSRDSNTLYKDNNIEIDYNRGLNIEFFETNNHIKFKLKNNDHSIYRLPIVHYSIDSSNDNPICYIYGIQRTCKTPRKDKYIEEYIRDIKRDFRNEYVSKDFILSLGLFLDLLYNNGIEDVRVPVYQVYNYDYHKRVAVDAIGVFNSYSEDTKKKYEEAFKNGDTNDIILDYIRDRNRYNRFVGMEDIISKNKTERLIHTFMLASSIFDNIDIINEPFIEGDELIIKIKNNTNILERLKEKNKEYSK